MSSTVARPTARQLITTLEAEAVTHVVTLPDNASAALHARLVAHPSIRTVTVTREGEAFAIAAGLWLGGKAPVVVIQNTGLLESGDGLRGTVQRMGVPLVVFVTYRGYGRMIRSEIDPRVRPIPQDALTRADVDSVALLTEPTLDAWGVPFDWVRSDDDRPRIHAAFAHARAESRPIALLLPSVLG